MITYLNRIRKPKPKLNNWKKLVSSLCITLFGILSGTLSKFLDNIPTNELPSLLETLDIRNFLGGFAIWLFIALCVSIYSRSPFQAALHVFLFFIGMVGSYYLYSHYIAGFFPQSYALIWIGLTALSPFLGYICWYASGNGTFAILLSAGILSVFINTAFAYGAGYIDLKSELELFVLILSLIVLRRRSIKEMILLVVLACLFAILFRFISPFQFW